MKRILLLLLCITLTGCKWQLPFSAPYEKPKTEIKDSLFVITLYSSMGSVVKTYIGKGKIEDNGQTLVFKDKDGKRHRISGGIVDIEYGD